MFSKKWNLNWLTLLTNLVIVAVATFIIVLAFPEKPNPHFKLEVGKPWSHTTLIAPFNFYIVKPEEAIKREQDQLLKEFRPYYIMEEVVEEKALSDFHKALEKDTTGVLKNYSELIERRLHFLYEQGIMSDQEYNLASTDTSNVIRIVRDKIETPTEISSVLPVMRAYDRIFSDEELKSHRAQLTRFNLFSFVRPNLKYDEKRNASVLDDLLGGVASVEGVVEKDEKIIDRGELVDTLAAKKIWSLEKEYEKENHGMNDHLSHLMGQVLFVGIFILLFTCYLQIFRKRYFAKPLNIVMLYLLIAIFPIAVSQLASHPYASFYILPFAVVPIITQVFFDSRTAFITLTTTVLISAVATNYQYEFIIVEMAGGMAAIYALSDMSKRAQLFGASIMATLCSAFIYYAMQLISGSEFLPRDRSMFAYLVISGVLSLLAYPLMYVIEKVFGFTSNITFFELSDTNQELLRMLSEKAPGTFAHSTTVGNLAAEVANRIGANALLVRTGALYHDIGKMENAVFFTENQVGINPHNKLSERGAEKESARIIISHVTEGLKLAEHYDLPDVITDFIRTHHGKGMARFFYVLYKNKHPEEEVDTAAFTYPGPNPHTREQAILMMADTVEAAVKSLTTYNDETISKKVGELIDAQVKAGYFEECSITFRDIAVAKQVLTERLKSIYHTRITYPKLNEEE
ncbi:MAG: HDIG domain-containing protein [Prevotella sp.]|nr:HDIG domain-containing protein [Prevotella sp.]